MAGCNEPWDIAEYDDWVEQFGDLPDSSKPLCIVNMMVVELEDDMDLDGVERSAQAAAAQAAAAQEAQQRRRVRTRSQRENDGENPAAVGSRANQAIDAAMTARFNMWTLMAREMQRDTTAKGLMDVMAIRNSTNARIIAEHAPTPYTSDANDALADAILTEGMRKLGLLDDDDVKAGSTFFDDL